jgi:cyclophilin family peptidyl-prolyl cis-trans isomerase
MSRIGWLAILVCLAARTALAQEAAPAAEGQAADAAAQPAEQPAAAEPAESQQPAADQPASPKPEAVAARQAFDPLLRQWKETIAQISSVLKQRSEATGEQRAQLDKQVGDLYKQADELIEQMSNVGLEVYKADPKAYSDVNDTLLAIARFHLTGTQTGDGGDQYEKAIKLIKGLIDAGAGDQWPQLYLWGALSAYNTNDFDLAEQYFAKWSAAGGGDAGLPQNLMESAAQYQQNLPAMKRAWEKESQLRQAEAKADDLPRVKLTTSKGDIVLEMFENEAPQSVANFITLVKQGFYDGVPFHRVLPGFMAQGGDPTGTGSGGPGYNIKDEQRLPNARKHFRGVMSMANTGQPNSGGSQFFLTFVPTSFLDGRHAVFGRVIEGMDVAAAIKRRDPDNPTGQPDKIIKAEVLRDRGHEYKFEKFPE